MSGALVVSLDFELLWGVLDKPWREAYAPAVRGGRAAVPRLLERFDEFGVRATWAAVGLILCEGRDEASERLKPLGDRPGPEAESLLSYVLRRTGNGERDDPLHYAPGLARLVASAPGQELGTHTFSHYHALEAGADADGFAADLAAAAALARDRAYAFDSLVLPRNQARADFLPIAAAAGLRCYRGNPPGILNAPRPEAAQGAALRAARLAEAYWPFPARRPAATREPRTAVPALPVDVSASRFLRPGLGLPRRAEALRLCKIKAEMAAAARQGRLYHLWWHPHNMGLRTEEFFEGLHSILTSFALLKDAYGFRSLTMAEAADDLSGKALA